MGRFKLSKPLAFAAVALAATPLLAAPADDVRTRVSGLRELGAAFKAVNDGLRASEPQMIMIQMSAKQIKNAATQMPSWFPKGSGPESGAKTAAKAEIWSQPAKFKAAQDAFVAEANNLQKASASNDVAAIRASTAKLGGTCKGCHDTFRVPRT
ncbi:MAG: cytochrome c [Novosphingobium sp.]|nr:cytochrome c [Novosphingobium sp.]